MAEHRKFRERGYDLAGNLLSLTDAEGKTTSYGYNDAGQRITEQYPDHVGGATIGQPGNGKQLRPPTDKGGNQADGGSDKQHDPLGRRTSKQDQHEVKRAAEDAPRFR